MGDRKNILFIGAHPDDVDFGCAIAMHDHYLRGDEITTIVLTSGDRGGDAQQRKSEQNNSIKLLAPNSRTIYFEFPDTRLFFQLHQVINQIRSVVLESLPDIVYIPSEHDFHQDHVITHGCALAVFNYIKVGRLLCYETPSTMPRFSPNFFKFCNPDVFKLKIDALRCHVSQLNKAYFSEDTITSIARMRASQCRCNDKLAEAYEAIRITEDLDAGFISNKKEVSDIALRYASKP